MSYCRWSSNDFQCDLYIYGDVAGGLTTHVAARRYVFDKPLPAELAWPGKDASEKEIRDWAEKEVARQKELHAMLDHDKMVDIGLPHDGATFNDPDGPSAAARVRELKALGYRVPDGVIEALEEEK